jgi:hypothetical protein
MCAGRSTFCLHNKTHTRPRRQLWHRAVGRSVGRRACDTQSLTHSVGRSVAYIVSENSCHQPALYKLLYNAITLAYYTTCKVRDARDLLRALEFYTARSLMRRASITWPFLKCDFFHTRTLTCEQNNTWPRFSVVLQVSTL